MTERHLHLGGFFSVPGNHLAGWRHPDADPSYDMDFWKYAHITKVAEAAKFDCIFFQDTVGVAGSRALDRGERTRAKLSRTVKLEPTATLAALAVVTERIGLVATATTTYNEPYNIARRFMSIDHISNGRAGWNLVTSQIEDESENFGFDQHMAHAERYERAAEFYDVVTGLWDSWEDGGLLRDKKSGLYMDREKVHFLDHVGKHFKVKGPLNITRSPQGWPVIAQAGPAFAPIVNVRSMRVSLPAASRPIATIACAPAPRLSAGGVRRSPSTVSSSVAPDASETEAPIDGGASKLA